MENNEKGNNSVGKKIIGIVLMIFASVFLFTGFLLGLGTLLSSVEIWAIITAIVIFGIGLLLLFKGLKFLHPNITRKTENITKDESKTNNVINNIEINEEDKNIYEKEIDNNALKTNIETGKEIKDFINDYVVIDVETTGLSPKDNELIELGALKVKDGKVIDQFETFINPRGAISSRIEKITGITDSMVASSPRIEDIIQDYINFIGDSIIVAHNASFDLGFICHNYKKYCNKEFTNNYICTLSLARYIIEKDKVNNYKLGTLAKYFRIKQSTSHRSIADCETTNAVYNGLKEKNDSLENTWHYIESNILINLTPTIDNIDELNPLYKKHFIFTGKLRSMTRREAVQKIVNLGGIYKGRMSKDLNYCIVGEYDFNNDYNKDIGKTERHQKAEEYIAKGYNVQILNEKEFIKLIGETP